MRDAHVDDLLRDLAAQLSIEPSPQMVARVRTRVYAGSPVRAPLASWTVGVAVAVLMIAIALGVAPDRRAGRQPVLQVPVRQPEASRQLADTPLPSANPQLAPDRERISIARRRENVRKMTTTAEPVAEVLVPPDQAIALRRILLAMRSGRSPVPPAIAEVIDAEGRLPAPEAIGIPPITIQPIAPLADGGRNKDR